jgi:hypothetical protein
VDLEIKVLTFSQLRAANVERWELWRPGAQRPGSCDPQRIPL